MSKRGASEQITRENFKDSVSDEEPGAASKASSSVLAKRKIIKPRGQKGFSLPSGNGNKNVGLFSFGVAGVSTNLDLLSSSKPDSKTGDDKNEKIKALNNKFVEIINSSHKPDTIVNFSLISRKYIEYYEKIESGSISDNTSNGAKETQGISTQPKNADSLNDVIDVDLDSSDDEQKKSIPVTGPTFTLTSKPQIKDSPFSFDKKKEKKNESDSELEVEIKGPTFTFNKPIKDSVFKLNTTEDAPKDKKENTGLLFGTSNNAASSTGKTTNAANEKDNSESQKNTPVSFGDTKSKSVFSFGSPAPAEPPKPAFSFQASTNAGLSSNTFSFGSSITGQNSSAFGATLNNTKPAFTFNTSEQSSDNKPKPFTFGSAGQTSQDSTPKFSFGQASSESKPFLFTETKKDDFTEGTEKPKSLFSFSAPKDSSNLSETNKDTKTDQSAPFLFSFTPKTNENAGKPLFSFGNNNNQNSNSFSFGNNAIKSNGGDSKDTEEDPSKDEPNVDFKPVASMSPEEVESKTGEENEEALYTKRAKLMHFNPSDSELPYTSKGLGDIKLLKNKSTGKTRFLMRAEGGLRVILNTLVNKDVDYVKMGNGSMVRVPILNPETNAIDTYVIKVKTPADGEELSKAINDAKAE